MFFHQINYKIHLWLGLITGLIIFIVGTTGCIMVFEDEIRTLTEPFQFVPKQDLSVKSPSSLISIARQTEEIPKVEPVLTRFDFRGEEQSAIVMLFFPGKAYNVFLNPYTGKVLKIKDLRKDFFKIVRAGHRSLWLGAIGKLIVGIATILFVLLLISGFVLWWPRHFSKTTLRKSVLINWSVSGKRLNYDLHNVLGFYSLLFSLILALSGLMISFNWVAGAVYRVVSIDHSLPKTEQYFSDTIMQSANVDQPAIDQCFSYLIKEHNNANLYISLFPCRKPTDPIWTIITPAKKSSIENYESRYSREFHYFDQYSLKELNSDSFRGKPIGQATAAEKLIRATYDIHTGRISSITTKLLAFLTSLVCASLPVTGFMIWYRKKNRKFN